MNDCDLCGLEDSECRCDIYELREQLEIINTRLGNVELNLIRISEILEDFKKNKNE